MSELASSPMSNAPWGTRPPIATEEDA
ncbi:MAG: hypothetical protein JWP62_3179, partial [Blastococcus sp.]|nr:hypothetical protein [Blastococcus sp.]